uniref:Membralin n=1 Tax=Salix viminalis TaxID=40686 RepID=A0A6N2MPU3_SALVM
MDTEQTFIRVQERFSQMLTPKVRAALEYMYLFIAITLFCILVVMHANYVQQPGCSSQLSGVETREAQLVQIKITSAGLWSQNESESNVFIDHDGDHDDVSDDDHVVTSVTDHQVELPIADQGDGVDPFLTAKIWFDWIGSGARKGKLDFKFWKTTDVEHNQQDNTKSSNLPVLDNVPPAAAKMDKLDARSSFPISVKETVKAAVNHFGKKWHRRLSFIWRLAKKILRGFQMLWGITGIHVNLDIPKWLRILYLDRLNSYAVQWLEKKNKAFEPTFLYTMEKGFFLLPEEAKSRHNIRTVNISISARHPCFGNRWQQLLINRLVGYDTILMNSLLTYPGQGYLYNFQTKEFYNLSYAQEPQEGPAKFGDYLVTKCGVLMMSLFVFFTTTMSVSFTLRETQTRMLKFTVQLQHHARHHLPTFQLIFVHVIESLVFVPFYDDQLLAFMVLILVWLCELFTLISVRTPISMKFFPRFFLLYFLVFHIYFFSYGYGFSYLALSTTAAFMQHLILYFWNRFEVPTLQRFMQNRRSQLQQHPDFHITSSTILASTLHITRLNTRNPGPVNAGMAPGHALRPGPDQAIPANGIGVPGLEQPLENDIRERVDNPMQNPGQADLQQSETNPNSGGSMNSFSSLLLWILGGASSEGINSFLSIFRDMRDQGQVYAESPRPENGAAQDAQQ